MRTPLLSYFNTLLVYSHNLAVRPVKTADLLCRLARGHVPSLEYTAVHGFNSSWSYAHAAFARELALGEVSTEVQYALMDSPNVKTFRLVFDSRLYSLKSVARLRKRSRRCILSPWNGITLNAPLRGFPYVVEHGAWGSQSMLGLKYWHRCRLASLSLATGGVVGLNAQLSYLNQIAKNLYWALSNTQQLGTLIQAHAFTEDDVIDVAEGYSTLEGYDFIDLWGTYAQHIDPSLPRNELCAAAPKLTFKPELLANQASWLFIAYQRTLVNQVPHVDSLLEDEIKGLLTYFKLLFISELCERL